MVLIRTATVRERLLRVPHPSLLAKVEDPAQEEWGKDKA